MSRTNPPTPSTTTQTQTKTPQLVISHEKIAMRAYEKWVKRGRPQGTDLQDWIEAEAELKKETGTSTTTSNTTRQAAGTTTSGGTGWTSPTGQRY